MTKSSAPIEIEYVVERVATAAALAFDKEDMIVSNNGRQITITQFNRSGVRRRFHITVKEEA